MMTDSNYFFSMNCRGRLVELLEPKIMGILNVTPDSFSDGGKFTNEKKALQQAEKMVREGAEIIDIGAQSTRPGAEKISAGVEISRIGKIISEIRKNFPEILISLDTFYGEVVKFGFDEGIDIVNDISAGSYDGKMLPAVAATGLPYILMHVNSGYENMHAKSPNDDIILKVNRFFLEKISELKKIGIKDIILDPGFGFGKTVEQNKQLISDLQFINFGESPLLAGISRKSFIYKPLGKNPMEINAETQRLHFQLLRNGAKILRVHDVAAAQQTVSHFLQQKRAENTALL